jgi:hypothetical protein
MDRSYSIGFEYIDDTAAHTAASGRSTHWLMQ